MMTPAQKAAIEYSEGCQVKAQIHELSDRSLARKFDCGRRAVARVADGQHPESLTAEDCRLIAACLTERAKLEAGRCYRTKPYLAKKHQTTVYEIERELQVMGFRNQIQARKARVVSGKEAA